MKQIELLSQANQIVSFVDQQNAWRVKLYLAMDRLLMDIEVNQASVHRAIVCDEKKLMMPYLYQYKEIGNLMFMGAVNYQNFGKECLLYYLDSKETAQFNQQLKQQFLLKI